LNAVALSLFSSKVGAVASEMGALLQRAAFSPNIKDRQDFSCALFDAEGDLCAQAAHIPVHLGSMAYAMADIVNAVKWRAGDMLILNNPYLGGTHLPDITLVAPCFIHDQCVAFVCNRAHHADIGAESPGSMPVSRSLAEEGLIIDPVLLLQQGVVDETVQKKLLSRLKNPKLAWGDFSAQIAANQLGLKRLSALIGDMSVSGWQESLVALNDYAERLSVSALKAVPDGEYHFCDQLDDDGQGARNIPISLMLRVKKGRVTLDFSQSALQVSGNVNCPLSVVAAAVYYAFRCLMPDQLPACAGSFRVIKLIVPKGCLLNACAPAAVAAGNVETSTRIVDAVFGALAQALPERIPAASQGSMNNVAMGSTQKPYWDYYETLGGGVGAAKGKAGASACHSHLTNTLNTPVESVEMHYPLRVIRYAIRRGSGGRGRYRGGDGLVRTVEFLRPTEVTLLTERRQHAPWGLQGGGNGQVGVNRLNQQELAAKICFTANLGDQLTIETPGGGGWGKE
jgi:N-methylhydantoinase B